MDIEIKRVYEPASPDDGYRALVDRLWPRGESKVRAELDEWCKDAAPSTDLRKWFNHQEELFGEFTTRYRAELDASSEPAALLKRAEASGKSKLTLVYGAKDQKDNQAVVLRDYLNGLQSK
ncbi:DUF488 domain-containing protein [Propionibacterium freudenreichii]|uniref:DUF488 domain-containing protein n=1 Tax=Propionibacterium freudenreichii TaxID=1744 RepID=UPI0005443260|nr:DUF488 domain-containing protein [Propionibacterium freudenreichii]MCT2980858.1 DUF488 domain-containing protein [Propionibacterium freudenreichii]MCT2997957.1 DUF488 domain-containing protein [Propionibacterium freudenreichii]MCT3002681.1 DUF488 domain-containing protein [Propionibacterium freudenreichii]MDK9319294.1 DUF488 domain-containing protein [Propionibacterium freudenreichii]MDK9332186.1 DUF488 domain-containing protein [Propionibacterium freudenreichii]